MRIVLDVNVLLSGLASNTAGTMGRLMAEWGSGKFDVILSDHIITTAERALRKPYWLAHQRGPVMSSQLSHIRSFVPLVEPAPGIHGVAEDEEDDLVLATAVAARADLLVTGDRYLLALEEFAGIPIVSPRDFVTQLLGFDPSAEP